MVPLILIGLAAVTLFTYTFYSWFRTFFYKAFELKLDKEFTYAFIFIAFAISAMVYIFVFGIVFMAGLIILSINHNFFFRTKEYLAILTVTISSVTLSLFSYCLYKAKLKAQKEICDAEKSKKELIG